MKLHENGFIGFAPNQSLRFIGTDSEELFYKNQKIQGPDWYYKDKNVEYNYNSLGHRCKDIDDINLSNYILFAGCSHTEGMGLELEKTYPYLVSETLNCDYYNLALGGTGIDVLIHNLLRWLTHVNNTPKILIVQWPEIHRFATLDHGNDNVIVNGIYNTEKSITDFILAGDDCNYFSSKREFARRLITTSYPDTKIIHVGVEGFSEYPNVLDFKLPLTDLARDLIHMGIESQESLATEIVNSILEN